MGEWMGWISNIESIRRIYIYIDTDMGTGKRHGGVGVFVHGISRSIHSFIHFFFHKQTRQMPNMEATNKVCVYLSSSRPIGTGEVNASRYCTLIGKPPFIHLPRLNPPIRFRSLTHSLAHPLSFPSSRSSFPIFTDRSHAVQRVTSSVKQQNQSNPRVGQDKST